MKTKTILFICTLLFCIGGGKLYAQTTETEIYITSLSELEAFRNAVNNGTTYEGHTICLTTDIDMTEVSWTPIGSSEGNPFKGHFEGWGHVIRNLSVSGNGDYAGLFGYISGGSVRDVGVEGTIISDGNYVGGICGYLAAGEISSCYSIATVKGNASVGGICGSSSGVVKNCWHKGKVEGTATKEVCAGGLVGYSRGTLQCCYLIQTNVIVPNIAGWNPSETNTEMNSYFGKLIGWWTEENDFSNCVYETTPTGGVYEDEGVKIVDSANNTPFIYGNDVVAGSPSGPSSPGLDETVIGATTVEMKSGEAFWKNGKKPLFNKESEKNNTVWKYEVLSEVENVKIYDYPKLNSFIKNVPITFDFSEKHWYSLVPNGNYAVPESLGVKAYKVTEVSGLSTTGGEATLVQVNALYEGCGVLIYREENTDELITFDSRPDPNIIADYSGNKLKGSPCSPDYIGEAETSYGDYILPSSDYTCYVLRNYDENNKYNPAFYIAGPGPMARGKAYLRVPTGSWSSTANLRFVIDDDASGIQFVEKSVDEEGIWYTLDGRKLEAAPTEKGVFIYNGKKRMIQ